jgi:hypothetical protein
LFEMVTSDPIRVNKWTMDPTSMGQRVTKSIK